MARSIANGTFSPPPGSSTASQSNGATTKLNIVSRLAIDGKAKQATEGARVYLYLKLNIPTDAVSPSQILPIFAEEGVKLKDHQVHPLDAESAPYDFSIKENPLLSKAARALNLPARSTKSYLSLFEGRSVSNSSTGRANGSVVPELEQRYSGYIIVSGYNICFVLPKEFPPTSRSGTDGSGAEARNIFRSSRRSSILGRPCLQYMVALEIWVPLTSKPPNAPYLISIPIPRCLSNTIKFRLFPPSSMSTSFASLSSDEDAGGWDLATVPHVNRTSMKHSTRTSAYSTLADDESSESSLAGLYDNCLIQGTFTSTERISIRWATPLKSQGFPEHADGRRRVQVGNMKSMSTCTILEQVAEGVKVRLDYQGICSNIWFPGVATLLGLDIVLDTQGYEVSWPGGAEVQWKIDGDSAMTGFNVGPPHGPLSRQSSLELPNMTIRSDEHSRQSTQEDLRPTASRSESTASLLRVPIPTQATSEYSFEDSPLMTPATSDFASLAASLTQSSLARAYAADTEVNKKAPSTPITLQINMNDLSPAPRNKFTFNISGTVIVSRSSSASASLYSVSSASDHASVQLPIFRCTTCDKPEESTFVRNQCDGANVELMNIGSGGSTISQDRKTSSNRKVVLPPGTQTKCGLEFSEILVAPLQTPSPVKLEGSMTPLETRRSSPVSRPSSSLSRPADSKGKSRMDEPIVIPWVLAKISPASPDEQASQSYAGTLRLPTPKYDAPQWLEIGFKMPQVAPGTHMAVPSLSVVCAIIDNIPVTYEISKEEHDTGSDKPSDDEGEKTRWLLWVRVKVASQGTLEIVYIAKFTAIPVKRKETDVSVIPVFLPHFYVPAARMEVELDSSSDECYRLCVISKQDHIPRGSRSLSEFALKPLGTPQVELLSAKRRDITTKPTSKCWAAFRCLISMVPLVALSVLLLTLYIQNLFIGEQLREIKSLKSSSDWSHDEYNAYRMAPLEVTKFITMTVTKTFSPEPTSTTYPDASAPLPPAPPPSSSTPPTIILSTPETRQQTSPGDDRRINMDLSALVPSVYVPLKWRPQIQVEDVRRMINFGWVKLKRAAVVILHWPLPVPADDFGS